MRKLLEKKYNFKKVARKGRRYPFGYGGILMVLSALFLIVQTFMANSLAVQGKEIRKLENIKVDLESDLNLLNQKSAQLSSLDSVRSLAKEKLGMVEGFDSFDYFGSSVALR